MTERDKYSSDLLAAMNGSMGSSPVYKKDELNANTNMRSIMSPTFAQSSMGSQTFPKVYAEEEQADANDGSLYIGSIPDMIINLHSSWDSATRSFTGLGTSALPDDPATGSHSSIFYWIPEKGSLRVGATLSGESVYANIGGGSIALGDLSFASGLSAVALGYDNSSTGTQSHAIGSSNLADGTSAIAIGSSNTATGVGSIAIGASNSTTIGTNAVLVGKSNASNGDEAMCFGTSCYAIGNSTAVGKSCNASGPTSFAFGWNVTCSGQVAGVIGNSLQGYTNSSNQSLDIVGYGGLAMHIPGDSLGNYNYGVGFGTKNFGTGANNTLSIGNGGVVTTAATNAIQIYSLDSAASKTQLCVFTEEAPITFGGESRILVRWNNVQYYIPLNGQGDTATTTVNAATYATLPTDHVLLVTYTATGACTITLDTDDVVAGRSISIIDAGGSSTTNNITVVGEGGETINGDASLTIGGDYDCAVLVSDGSNWFIGH